MSKTPFEKLWEFYDKREAISAAELAPHEKHRNPNQPLFRETGGFSADFPHRLIINLSSIETFLIQETGRYCERYASDLLISWNSIKETMADRNPFTQVSYQFLGIRKSGVDGLSYVMANIQQYKHQISYLEQYYRKLYGIRILHPTEDKPFVTIELRDCSQDLHQLARHVDETGFQLDAYQKQQDESLTTLASYVYHTFDTYKELQASKTYVETKMVDHHLLPHSLRRDFSGSISMDQIQNLITTLTSKLKEESNHDS